MSELHKCYSQGLLRKVEPSKIKSRQSLIESDKWDTGICKKYKEPNLQLSTDFNISYFLPCSLSCAF